MGKANISISPTDFLKQNQYGKLISLSFFDDKKETVKTSLAFFLVVNFAEKDKFWERSQYIATALDFLKGQRAKFKQRHEINFSYNNIIYEVKNAESYREKMVESIYIKSKTAAAIIAKQEKKALGIKEITLDQKIHQEILNFNKASLSLNATIKFGFEKE